MEATVFNIQRYSLHDGGGIRSIVFFKGCPFTCPWCCNPESLSVEPQLMFKKSLCIGCSMKDNHCSSRIEDCPTKAKSVIGKVQSIEDVMDVLVRDKIFYETSNGGITLSGGEVLLQQDFALALLKACQQEDIHTAIETTLALPIKNLEKWVSRCQLFLVDLKIMDAIQSKKILRIDIDLVKENIKKLMTLHANIIIRIPLIPQYTATKENISAIIAFMQEVGLKEVHLLPYHNLGESKYRSLNLNYSLYDLEAINDSIVEEIKENFERTGIKAVIHGN